MSKLTLLLILLILLIHKSYARVAPDFIKPCSVLTKECIESVVPTILPDFVKGAPLIELDSLDPLLIDHLEFTLPGNLKIELDNGTVRGLGNCSVGSISFENDEGILNFLCNVTFKGKYKANGNLLIMTINGDGDAKIRASNVALQIKIKFHDVVKKGITYYEIKYFDLKYKLGDKMTFQLTNLFRDNPELSQAVLQFINENWKQISEEFGEPIFQKLMEIIFNILKKFFITVPKNEIVIK